LLTEKKEGICSLRRSSVKDKKKRERQLHFVHGKRRDVPFKLVVKKNKEPSFFIGVVKKGRRLTGCVREKGGKF